MLFIDKQIVKLKLKTTKETIPSPFNILSNQLEICIDPITFDRDEQAFSSFFLTQLLEGKSIRLVFCTDSVLSGQLHKLLEITEQDKEKITGFGYPLFINENTDDEKRIVTPLFIWEVQFVQKSRDTWMVKSNGNTSISLNAQVFSYLEEEYPNIHQELNTYLSEKGSIPKRLLAWCRAFSRENNIKLDNENWGISKTLTLNSLDEGGSQHSAVLSCGVFSPFFEQNCLAIKANTHEDEVVGESPLVEAILEEGLGVVPRIDLQHTYSPFLLNPSQLFVLKAIGKHGRLNVNGIAGTEKTELITAMICNWLLHDKKCLFVTKNETAIELLSSMFEKLGLSVFCLDVVNEKHFAKSLAHFSKLAKGEKHEEDRYQLLLQSCNYWLKEVEKERTALSEPLVGDLNWKDLVSEFLKYDEIGEGELLFPLLDPRRFSFSTEELESLHKSILISEKYYHPSYVLAHPLVRLHADVYIEKYFEEANDFCRQQLAKHKKTLIFTRQKMVRSLEQYRRDMSLEYEAFYWKVERRVQALLHIVNIHLVQFGAEFEKIDHLGNAKLKIESVFSNKKKDILETRKSVSQGYKAIKKEHEQLEPFPFDFPALSAKFNYASLLEILESYRQELLTWQAELPATIERETLTLSSLDKGEKSSNFLALPKLEEDFEQAVFQLNAVKLYQEPFSAKPVYYHEKINYLDQIAYELEKIEQHLDDFEGFYAWQKHWYSLETLAREVVLALHKARPKDWKSTFKNWYWHQALHRNMDGQLPYGTASLSQFASTYNQYKALVANKIIAKKNQKRRKESRELKKENKELWEQLSALTGKMIPKQQFSFTFETGDLEILLRFFPVCFITSNQLALLSSRQKTIFDLALVDDKDLPFSCIESLAKTIVAFKPSEYSARFNNIQTNNQFISEIAKRLSQKIDPKFIQTQVRLTKDFVADLLIKSKDRKNKGIVIQCDGIAGSRSEGMVKCLQNIKDEGYHYLETWSINWWKNAEGEMIRLLEAVNKIFGSLKK